METYNKYNSRRKRSYYYKKPFYKKWWFILIILIIICGTGFIIYALSRPNQSQNDSNDIIFEEDEVQQIFSTLSFFDGEVSVKNHEQANWDKVDVTTELETGNFIKTGQDSKAIIEFSDGSIIRLNADTEIQILEIELDKISVFQNSGNTYNRINKSSDILYKVFTEYSVTTALGTAFDINFSENQQNIAVIESEVKVELINNNDDTVAMKNVEQEQLCTIDTANLEYEVTTLEEDDVKTDWFQWNKTEDNKKYFDLGFLDKIQGPQLEITDPEDEAEVEEDKIDIKGTVDKEATIKVNNEEITNNSGEFSTTIELETGKNVIEVIAENTEGEKTIKTITINYKTEEDDDNEDQNISLSATVNAKDVKLAWDFKYEDNFEGFRILKSLEKDPIYPSDSYRSVTDSATNYIWSDLNEDTYHFRICIYDDNQCQVYSNNVEVAIKKSDNDDAEEDKKDAEISLSGSSDDGKVYLTWTVSGTDATNGFKVVASTSKNPTYPDDKYHSLNDATTRNDVWNYLTAGKKYYFRVCETVNDNCGNYSNNLEITVAEPLVESTPPTGVSLSADVAVDGVHLFWTKNNDSDFKYYKVVKSSSNSNPKYPADGYVASKNQDDLSYFDTEVTNSTPGSFYYSVCSVNSVDLVTCSNVITVSN